MAIVDLGSHLTLTSAVETGHNGNVSVPSGTTVVIIAAAYFKANSGFNIASCSLAGVGFTNIDEQSSLGTATMTHLAYVADASLGTGTQNLTIVWDDNPSEGPVVYVFFYSGVDTSTPVEDSGGEQDNSSGVATTGALTNDSGDWFVGVASGYTSTAVAWDNATEDDEDIYGNIIGAYAHLSLSGANHTETVTLTGHNWCAISGAILNAEASSSSSQSTSLSSSSSSESTSVSSSSSSESTSVSSSSSSESTSVSSSSSSESLSNEGWTWGEQNPDPETAIAWSVWKIKETVNDARDSGDWGELQLGSGEEFVSDVKDIGSVLTRYLTLSYDDYAVGSGSGILYWRGQAATFNYNDDEVAGPTWELYSAANKSWRYIQLMCVG